MLRIEASSSVLSSKPFFFARSSAALKHDQPVVEWFSLLSPEGTSAMKEVSPTQAWSNSLQSQGENQLREMNIKLFS